MGCLTKKKPYRAFARYGFFYFHPFRKQDFFRLSIRKPGALRQDFFFVDKVIEISNLELMMDLVEVIKIFSL
jgi:hypothetical protein